MARSYIDERYHGAWYGVLDGEDLPVGHDTCCNEDFTRYVDRGCREPLGTPVNQRWLNWMDAVRKKKRIVIQKTVETGEINRDGYPVSQCVDYVGLFAVENGVQFDKNGDRVLSFDLKLIRRI
jgi:hypothetical protein